MGYTCPACGASIGGDMIAYVRHTEAHIIDILRQKHPEWVEKDGICRKCLDHYRSQISGAPGRSFQETPGRSWWVRVRAFFSREAK